MQSLSSSRALFALALVFVAVSGCTPTKSPPQQSEPLRIDSFTGPTIVEAGKSIDLQWSVSGPLKELRILRGQERLTVSTAANDHFTVPTVDAGETLFTLVADGQTEGVSVAASLTVRGVSAATIVSFTVDQSAVASGKTALLSWQTVAAAKVVISDGATAIAQFTDAEAAHGNLVVRPTVATTYTLTASTEVSSDSKSLSVAILEPPRITSATATPTRVTPRETVTVAWTTESAETLTIRSARRVLFQVTGEEVAAGSRSMTLAEDTTFILLAEGPGGSTTAKVDVAVGAAPQVRSFQALPSMVLAGAPFLLQWTTAGVDTCDLMANGVSIAPAGVPGSGSLSQTLQQTTMYRLDCVGEGGEVSRELSVNVFAVPQVISFTSDRYSLVRREQATLTWQTSDAPTISIVDENSGTPFDLGDASPAAGSIVISPRQTTKYMLTAYGEGGLVTSVPLLIQVQDPAPAISLSLARNPIQESESTELSWQILDATSFSATATGMDGVPHPINLTGKKFSDLVSLAPSETTVYTFAAENGVGRVEESIQLHVQRMPHFEYARAVRTYVTRGTPIAIEWKTTDADTVSMVNPLPPLEGDSSNAYVTIEGMPGTQALNPAIGDNTMATLNFPNGFAFPFFEQTYAQAYIATDGYLCFASSQCLTTMSQPANQAMPNTTIPNALVAPFWDDLSIVDVGAVSPGSPRSNFLWRIDGTAPNRRVTVEWRHMEFKNLDLRPADLNFQVVLQESGGIEIWNAPRMPPTEVMHPFGTNDRWGTSASIGYEGPGGLVARTAQAANDPNAGALCRSFVPGTTTSPRVDSQCDLVTRLHAKTYPATGSTSITADAVNTTTVTVNLTATGPLGTVAAAPIAISLADAPMATSLLANNSYVGAGEPVELTWVAGPNKASLKSIAIVDAQENVVFSLNSAQIAAPIAALQGKVTVRATVSTTYSLVVTNLADDVAKKTADVKVDKPTATFTVDKPVGPSGEVYLFSWSTQGAQQLSLLGPDGVPVDATFPLLASVDRNRIANGSISLPITQTGIYTLHTENGSGATDIPVTVTVSSGLVLFSLRSNLTEQTAQRPVVLSWETFNATDMKVELVSHVPPITVVPQGVMSAAQRRSYNVTTAVDDTTSTYRLTAYQDDGHGGVTEQTRDITVSVVPQAKVVSFTATPAIVDWNSDPVTISWVTQDATKLKLYEMLSTDSGAPNGVEIMSARDQMTGSFTTKLTKSTRYRLVMQNRLGDVTSVELVTPVTVRQTSSPSMTLTLNPTAAPNGGYIDLAWAGSNVEKVYLWRRNPWDSAGNPGSTVDPVQLPFVYRPYDFVDISSSGTLVTLKNSLTSSAVVNYDTGFSIVDFPADFMPEYFGEVEGRVLISADGVLLLAPPGTPDTSTMFSCAGNTTTGSCTSVASSFDALNTTTVTQMRNLIAPFWANLSAKNNCAGLTTDPAACQTGRAPGRVYYQLIGEAPNRVFIVQWEKWDVKSSSYSNTSLTFQAKIYENGDVEYQYKTMQSSDFNFARGSTSAVGLERRFQTGTYYRNYYLQLPKTTTTSSAKAFIQPGDGWRIYSGAQAPSGQIRTNFNTPRTFTSPQSVMFRATGYVTGMASPPVASQVLNVTAGVDQIVISEIMVHPDGASGEGKQWIELRNMTTAAIPLMGYTIETSSGSYTFQGTESIPANGYFLLAQQNAVLPDNGTPIFRLPNSSSGVLLSEPADAVILRYGQVLIDRVEYDATEGWSIPLGASMSLDVAAQNAAGTPSILNDIPEFWCSQVPANTFSGIAARPTSTPGTANVPCHYFDLIPYDPAYEISSHLNATIALNAVDTGDDRTASVDIGFPFSYFGGTYAKINVNDNGFACFGSVTSIPASNSVLPAASSYGGIDAMYVFWDDLKRAIAGRGVVRTETLGTAPNRAFVIQWDGYTFSDTVGSGELVFMLVLKESGEIEYHYATLDPNGTTTQHQGSSATIGLDAYTKTFGVQVTNGSNSGTVTTWTPPMYQLPAPSSFALKAYKAP